MLLQEPLPARSVGELNTQYRAKIKGATVDKEAGGQVVIDSLEKPKGLGKSLFQTKIKSRLAEVAAIGRASVSDSDRAWNSSASETSEKEDTVTSIQSIPVQLIRMVPATTLSAATMQRAVSHATLSNLTRATASASSRAALSAQRPRSHSVEALLEEVSYKPLQPYSFPTGSIQPLQHGRHDSGEDFPASSHPHLASASSRLDRLRLQVSHSSFALCSSHPCDLLKPVVHSASCAVWKACPPASRALQIWSLLCRKLCRRRSTTATLMSMRRGFLANPTRRLLKKRRSLPRRLSPVPYR